MARTKKEPNRVDDLLDELLEDCHSPEDILGESGLMKQIKKRLIERALADSGSDVRWPYLLIFARDAQV